MKKPDNWDNMSRENKDYWLLAMDRLKADRMSTIALIAVSAILVVSVALLLKIVLF